MSSRLCSSTAKVGEGWRDRGMVDSCSSLCGACSHSLTVVKGTCYWVESVLLFVWLHAHPHAPHGCLVLWPMVSRVLRQPPVGTVAGKPHIAALHGHVAYSAQVVYCLGACCQVWNYHRMSG
jgi:hypothetical protein